MPKFGPKGVVPVLLGVKQISDLYRYAEVSGYSRNELVRRAVQLFFDQLREDEAWREIYQERPELGYRDEG